MNQKLTTTDHSRNAAGLNYIYPVISRRAGGLSIGINVNTNNACNWRCVYCQVPDLIRGSAPKINFQLLENEFRFFLNFVLNGDFFDQYNVPEQQRVIKDIAISGNGEPTSVTDFDQLVEMIGKIATQMNVLPDADFILITNGSLMYETSVQKGLLVFQRYQGQVWFKLDSATEQGRKKINDIHMTNKKVLKNLQISIEHCETSIQMCMLEYLPHKQAVVLEHQAYLQFLETCKKNQLNIVEILLYSIARPSLQSEANQLNKVSEKELNKFASKIISLGYAAKVSC